LQLNTRTYHEFPQKRGEMGEDIFILFTSP